MLDGTTPYEISTTYSGSQLADIKYVQSADTFYLVHPEVAPAKLVRNSPTDWVLSTVDFINGPFLDENEDTTITITATAVSGTVTLSSSADVFSSGHVDTLWRLDDTQAVSATLSAENTYTSVLVLDIGESLNYSVGNTWVGVVTLQKSTNEGTTWNTIYITESNLIIQIYENNKDNTWYRAGFKTGEYSSGDSDVSLENVEAWGYVKIDTFVSATEVTATVRKQLPSTNATSLWREGAWSESNGYPGSVIFFEQRLLFGGNANEPQDIWGSKINKYENFGLGVIDDASYNFTLVSNAQNTLLWMVENRVLHVGTLGGEWKFGYADQTTTPTNVDAKSQTSDGSSSIQALVINNTVIFIQKGGKVLRSKIYDYNIDGYKSNNISIKASNLLSSGVVDMAFQNGVTPILWLITDDGDLIGNTYQPTQEVIAFHKHTTDGYFESVVVIPGADREEVWVVVKRNINGTDTRYIELFQTDAWDDHEDAYFSDAAIPFDGTAKTTFSGAGHLEGETVTVLADGSVRPDVTISGGIFTIDGPAADKVIIGLGYDAVLKTMPINPPIETGSSFGKNKKVFKTSVNLYETIGVNIGSTADNTDIIPFRSSAAPMGHAPDIFTGLKQIEFIKGFDKTQSIAVTSTQPLPCTILSLSYTFYGSPT